MKVYPKTPQILPYYNNYFKQFKEQQDLFLKRTQFPNILPNIKVLNMEIAGVVIRQYIPFNLIERLRTMPYLSNIEKKWISFQILYSISQLHNRGQCHGDIKMRNVLLTSSMSVFLSDISTYKPTYIKPDDLTNYSYFFLSNSIDENSCYTAPERFTNSLEIDDRLKPKMDVFSVGALIAEIFLEDTLFTHSLLLDYKKGTFQISSKLSRLKYPLLEDLLFKMMQPDPSKRISLDESIKIFANQICPIPIPHFILHVNILIVCYNYYQGDLLIGLICKHWKQIYKCLYINEAEVKIPKIRHQLNYKVIGKLLKSKAIYQLLIEDYHLIFINYQNDREDNDLDKSLLKDLIKTNATHNNSNECSILILKYLLYSIQCAKYNSSKILGIELIEYLTQKVLDIVKIEVIIPYLVALLSIESINVQLYSFDVIIRMLSKIKEDKVIVTSIDYYFFGYYVFDKLFEMFQNGNILLKCAFLNCLDSIIDIELKFVYIRLNSFEFNSSFALSQFSQKNDELNNMMKSSIFFTKSNFIQNEKINLNIKREDFFNSSENELKVFKEKIKILGDIILFKESEDELQLLLLQKVPRILLLFGPNEIISLKKYLMVFLNKNNISIKIEWFKIFPCLFLIVGQKRLLQYYIIFIESVIHGKMNEIVVYHMIHSVIVLTQMNFIPSDKLIQLFQEIFQYIIHPNYLIRKELVLLGKYIFNSIDKSEIYTYLWKLIKENSNLQVKINFPYKEEKDYLYIGINENILTNFSHFAIKRYIFQLIKYNFEVKEVDDKVKDIILLYENQRVNLKGKTTECELKIDNVKIRNISNEVIYFISKEIKNKLLTKPEEIESIQEQFAKDFISLTKKSKNEKHNTNWLFQSKELHYIKLKNLIKCLDINNSDFIKSNPSQPDQTLSTNSKIYHLQTEPPYEEPKLISNFEKVDINNNPRHSHINKEHYFFNDSSKWKIEGNLLETEIVNSFEKVIKFIPLKDTSQFISITNNMTISTHLLEDNEYETTIKTTSKLKNNISQEIGYQNISFMSDNDNTHYAPSIVIANNQNIILYNIETFTNEKILLNSNDIENTIISISPYNNLYENFLCSTTKCEIKNFDMRRKCFTMTEINYPSQYGAITSIGLSYDQQNALLGTSRGHLLKYDYRINGITDIYAIKNSKSWKDYPIRGIIPFYPDINIDDYDLYSLKINKDYSNGYYFIYTNDPQHSILLFNSINLNIDLMLTVSHIEDNKKDLEFEIPTILFNHIPPMQRQKCYRENRLINNGIRCALCPNNSLPYILTADNDSFFRYWDFSMDNMRTLKNKNSRIIVGRTEIENFVFSKTALNTSIIQSNEIVDSQKNYTNYSMGINDILFRFKSENKKYLISGSNDGTIKLWS